MYATPFASVGASAATQRTSGQSGLEFHVLFAITESAPEPLKPWADVPPLNRTQISAAAMFGIGLLFTSFTTTLIRALFGRLAPPSLFGQPRKKRVANVPST